MFRTERVSPAWLSRPRQHHQHSLTATPSATPVRRVRQDMAVKQLLAARGEGADGADESTLDLQARPPGHTLPASTPPPPRQPPLAASALLRRVLLLRPPRASPRQAYVELQQEIAKVLRAHRAALAASRRFWRLLVRHPAGPTRFAPLAFAAPRAPPAAPHAPTPARAAGRDAPGVRDRGVRVRRPRPGRLRPRGAARRGHLPRRPRAEASGAPFIPAPPRRSFCVFEDASPLPCRC